jgi:hypothetical protein
MSLTDEQLKDAHVEITCFPCSKCGGHGEVRSTGAEGPQRRPCEACDMTGRERVLVRLEDLPGLWARKMDAAETEAPPAADGDDTVAMAAPAETLPEPTPVDPAVQAADGG